MEIEIIDTYEKSFRNYISTMKLSRWEVQTILGNHKYSEQFLREVWSVIWPAIKVFRQYHLSLDFLREFRDTIYWTDLICYNDTYTKEEKDYLIKEFNLISDDDKDFWYELRRNNK